MNRTLLIATLAASLVATRLTLGQGRSADAPGHNKDDDSSEGVEQVPDSSVDRVEDHGHRAHTNHVVFLRGKTPPPPPAPSEPKGFYPQQIETAYNLPALNGSGVIAIVDAYDYPTARADFDAFSAKFGLSTTAQGASFQVVYGSGHKPGGNCGWNQEAALDIEWAHAMAPKAAIILVEAASSSFADLFQAVAVAGTYGPSQVSMSWGGNEFSAEHAYDTTYLTNPNIAYFAAAGDTAGQVIYPSASPNVISAGGTTLVVGSTGVTETAWGSSKRGTSGSGGGPSAYEVRPSWQNGIVGSSTRGTPDMSFDADPATGVAVYDSTVCQGSVGWMVFGGTSVSAPSLAGIINGIGAGAGSNQGANLYAAYGNPSAFRDITTRGSESTRYTVGMGWDFVTGLGSLLGGFQ